jgi:hypothetical protein
MLRYKDESILVVEMMNTLNAFMMDMGFFGVDDGLSKFYLFCGIDGEPCLSAWCKPCIFNYEAQNERSQERWQEMLDESTNETEKALIKKIMIKDEELDKECADNQRDALDDLNLNWGGYEIITFNIELTDAEKQQLKKATEINMDKKELVKTNNNVSYVDNYYIVYIMVYWWRDNQLSDEDFNTLIDELYGKNPINSLKEKIKNNGRCFNSYQAICLMACLMREGRLTKDDFRKMTDNFYNEGQVEKFMEEI